MIYVPDSRLSGVGAVYSCESSEISSIKISYSIYRCFVFEFGRDKLSSEFSGELCRFIELCVVLLLPVVAKIFRGEANWNYLCGVKFNSI